MRIALVVSRVSQDAGENLGTILSGIKEASAAGASLVVFPEAALTGLINDGDPAHDLPLGVAIPGKETALIGMAAKAHSIYVALGLFEREGDSLFDSAILIDSDGQIAMKYRRISVGWCDPTWNRLVYKEGSTLDHVATPLGSMAFLICGDLFDDSLCASLQKTRVEYLLCPMARNFDDNSYSQERWDREEKDAYAARAALGGATMLLVNQLGGDPESGDAFGGAMIVTSKGVILHELPLGREGLLIATL